MLKGESQKWGQGHGGEGSLAPETRRKEVQMASATDRPVGGTDAAGEGPFQHLCSQRRKRQATPPAEAERGDGSGGLEGDSGSSE